MSATADDDTTQGPPPRLSSPKRKPEPIVIQARANESHAYGRKAAAPKAPAAPGDAALSGEVAELVKIRKVSECHQGEATARVADAFADDDLARALEAARGWRQSVAARASEAVVGGAAELGAGR